MLEKYSLGLAEEACDPTCGAALAMDWLGLHALGDWLDGRMDYYAKLARYQAPTVRLDPPSDPTMAERCCKFLASVADVIRGRNEPSPLDRLQEQRAEARTLRLDEVRRRAAEAPLSRAEYKPLCDWKYRPSKSEPAVK